MKTTKLWATVLMVVLCIEATPYGQDAPPPAPPAPPPPALPPIMDCSTGECIDPSNPAGGPGAAGPASPWGGSTAGSGGGAGGQAPARGAASIGSSPTDACTGTMTAVGDCVWNGGAGTGWEEQTQKAVEDLSTGAIKGENSIDFKD